MGILRYTLNLCQHPHIWLPSLRDICLVVILPRALNIKQNEAYLIFGFTSCAYSPASTLNKMKRLLHVATENYFVTFHLQEEYFFKIFHMLPENILQIILSSSSPSYENHGRHKSVWNRQKFIAVLLLLAAVMYDIILWILSWSK
jgi:hypothetical protein